MKQTFYRYLLLVVGVIMMAFTGSVIIKMMIGSGPLSLLFQGFAFFIGVPFGTSVLILNIVFVTLLALLNYRKIGIGTVFVTLFIGPLSNLFLGLIPTPQNPFIAYSILILACVINGLGIALYIYPNIGLSPFEGVMIAIHERIAIPIKYLKIIMDAVFVLLGFWWGGIIGFGTIIALVLTGPSIDFFYNLLIRRYGKIA